MDNLENNEDLVPAKKLRKAFGTNEPELTELEAGIQARRTQMNEPALCAFFGITHEELTSILLKLPPVEDCNC